MSYDYLGEPDASYRIIGYRLDCQDPAAPEGEDRKINIIKEVYVENKGGKKSLTCTWRVRGFWKKGPEYKPDSEVMSILTMNQQKLFSSISDMDSLERVKNEIEEKVKELFEVNEGLKARNAVIVPPQSPGITKLLVQR
jgi:hypothetical protein